MQIFQNQEVLYGNFHIDGIKTAMSDFWRIAREIRSELGNKSYYLDEYLSEIFGAINGLDALNVASDGENTYSAFWSDTLSLCGSEIDRKGYVFYEEIKKQIELYALDYQEKETNTSIYVAKILFNYLKTMVNEFVSEIINDSDYNNSNDYQVAKERFNQISEIVGSKKAERLESAFDEAFLVCPASMIFVQAIISRLVGALCIRDPQTSKQIFQLVLDSKN